MRKGFLVFMLVCFASMSFAQNKDFSGTWNFKEQESISGKLYTNGSPKSIKITQTVIGTTYESTSAGANGDVTTSTTIAFDGKAFEGKTASGRKRIITLTWNGTSGYTTVASIYDSADPNKLVFKTTDVWTMENERLVLQRKAENIDNGEVWESKAYYEK